MGWLIKDISRELVAWGHAGGTEGHIIIKNDESKFRFVESWPTIHERKNENVLCRCRISNNPTEAYAKPIKAYKNL